MTTTIRQTKLYILPVGGSLCSSACLAPYLKENTFMSFNLLKHVLSQQSFHREEIQIVSCNTIEKGVQIFCLMWQDLSNSLVLHQVQRDHRWRPSYLQDTEPSCAPPFYLYLHSTWTVFVWFFFEWKRVQTEIKKIVLKKQGRSWSVEPWLGIHCFRAELQHSASSEK